MPTIQPTAIRSHAPLVEVAEQRPRTAPRLPEATFGNVLRRGAGLLLRGAEVGAAVALGPILPLAVRGGAGGALVAAGGPLGAAGAPASEQGAIDQMRAMQSESQAFNLQYMALQEEVQQENRRFTTVSNVLKAKHETAKGAIGNIRA